MCLYQVKKSLYSITCAHLRPQELTNLSHSLRKKDIQWKNEGKTLLAVSKLFYRSKSMISRILKLRETIGYNKSSTRKGRPRKTTRRDNRAMHRMSLVDRSVTTAGICVKFVQT